MRNITTLILLCFFSGITFLLQAQPELYPWGNINGIRFDGELMELNTSMAIVGTDWQEVRASEKEVGRYQFHRIGGTQEVEWTLDEMQFNLWVEDLGAGRASVRIQQRALKDTTLTGTFLRFSLPHDEYDLETLELEQGSGGPLDLPPLPGEYARGLAAKISIEGIARDLQISLKEPAFFIVQEDTVGGHPQLVLWFALQTGSLNPEHSTFNIFDVLATGVADLHPLTLTLDPSSPGEVFTGFGGNFRLQNQDSDPGVIDYCLENMDVRWGRVEMPWSLWHPDEEEDPVNMAAKGEIHPHVKASMEMAARLHELGMPVILSDWSAPDWAILGKRTWGPQPGGLRGNPLNQEKAEKIYKSIADYIQYVKDHYGFEFAMFSFNESDLGIYVRQTPEEHAKLIRELGAYLEKRGLKTKLLLGDTADAKGWPFLKAAMEDSDTHPYIAAVSFHSWRAYSDENLLQWAEAARKMDLPLLVGEGSMDAGAHRYPDIFSEPMYAMEEMQLYIRIMKLCQPEAILQWQLTADYSPMTGGGVFGHHHVPLTPTQRFWNFKQIADMPAGLRAMPVEADRDHVLVAGLGDEEKGQYVVHVVNTGAARQAVLEGFPEGVRFLKIYVTNERRHMAIQRITWIRNGRARFYAPANSFITLLADRESPW